MSKMGMQIDSSSAGGRAARVRAHLSGVPLFKELSAQEMDPIVGGTTEIPVARGDIIFRRGDSCTGFHIVVSGQVKLILVSPEGVEKVVRLVGPGDSFGEALMFMGKDYIVTSQALADTLLLHVGRDVLFEQIERQPVLARRMLAGLSRRLHALMGDVETYSMRSGVQRVIGYLLKDPDVRAGIPFRLETGKSVIASRLSITPEHFSRILRELNDRGLIRMRGREITVGDLDALASYRG